MNRRLVTFLVALVITTLTLFGCKGKVEKTSDVQMNEVQGLLMPEPTKDEIGTTEPAQTVATQDVTVASPVAEETQVVSTQKDYSGIDIQKALKKAGYYAGEIDGKIGPQTKKAIMEFQTANALKVDGKVGPQTWTKLQQYLSQQ